MLKPEIKLAQVDTFCTCGKPNFRLGMDTRPVYDIYEVIIPKAPYGYTTHFLCTDCLKALVSILDPIKAAGGRYCRDCRHSSYDAEYNKRWCNRNGCREVKTDGSGHCDLSEPREAQDDA